MIAFHKLMQYLSAPEIFTPRQWAEHWGASNETMGNRLFALGMIKAAWDDARVEPNTRRKMLDRQSALDWIRGNPSGRIPMTTCCEFLGLDPDWLRSGLLLRIQKESLHATSRQFKIKSISPHHTAMKPRRAAQQAARLAVLKLPL